MTNTYRPSSRLGVCAVSVLTLAVLPTAAHSQMSNPQSFARHAVYVEVGGLPAFEGGAYTANYEHRIAARTYIRVGVFAGRADDDNVVMVPVLLNALLSGRRHHLELGGGVRLDVVDAGRGARLAATAGYRWQPPGRRVVLRAGFAFDLGPNDWSLYPWPALGFGLAF